MGGTGPAIERPEFEIPEHPVGSGAPFSRDDATARRAVAALYRSAANVLEDVARQGFGRGLCVIDDRFIAAGSTPSTVTVFDLETQDEIAGTAKLARSRQVRTG